jgi:predicted Zn-dependent peptidase
MEKKYSLDDFGVKKHEGVLQNGLKVIFIEKPFAPIHAEIAMRAGQIYEPEDKPGLAHFTEHVIASGSSSKNVEEMSQIMESIGGYSNASTGEELMSVECEIALPEHLPRMREYFLHALSDIHITEEILARERGVITSEIERALSDPKYNAFWYLYRFFANGSRWGKPNLGTIQSISSFTKDDVMKFFETYCVVENMSLVVAGGCTWSDVERTFGDIPFLHGALHELPAEPEPIPPQIIPYEQDIPQTTVMIGFLAPKVDTRENSLLNFALRIAHGGLSSRFFKKIRNERGLAYNVSRTAYNFKNLAYVGTSVGVPTNKVSEARQAILECYEDLIKEGVSQKEIDDKIDTMWFGAHRNMQVSEDWVSTFSYEQLYPDKHPLHGPFPDIYNYRRTYTADEINEVLKKYITLDSYYLVLNGKNLPKK